MLAVLQQSAVGWLVRRIGVVTARHIILASLAVSTFLALMLKVFGLSWFVVSITWVAMWTGLCAFIGAAYVLEARLRRKTSLEDQRVLWELSLAGLLAVIGGIGMRWSLDSFLHSGLADNIAMTTLFGLFLFCLGAIAASFRLEGETRIQLLRRLWEGDFTRPNK